MFCLICIICKTLCEHVFLLSTISSDHPNVIFLFSCSLSLDVSVDSTLSIQSCERERTDYNGLDFRLIVDTKSGPPVVITLVASTQQEKAAWCSDISQVWLCTLTNPFFIKWPDQTGPAQSSTVGRASNSSYDLNIVYGLKPQVLAHSNGKKIVKFFCKHEARSKYDVKKVI